MTELGHVEAAIPYTLRGFRLRSELRVPTVRVDADLLARQKYIVGESRFLAILGEQVGNDTVDSILELLQSVTRGAHDSPEPAESPWIPAAWLVNSQPTLVVDQEALIEFRLAPSMDYSLLEESDEQELLVMIWAGSADVEPAERSYIFSPTQQDEPLEFTVTPREEGELRIRFIIRLAREGYLLHELTTTVPVVAADVRTSAP
jgi:hypothetical protein